MKWFVAHGLALVFVVSTMNPGEYVGMTVGYGLLAGIIEMVRWHTNFTKFQKAKKASKAEAEQAGREWVQPPELAAHQKTSGFKILALVAVCAGVVGLVVHEADKLETQHPDQQHQHQTHGPEQQGHAPAEGIDAWNPNAPATEGTEGVEVFTP